MNNTRRHFHVCLTTYTTDYLLICLSIYLHICLTINLSVYLSTESSYIVCIWRCRFIQMVPRIKKEKSRLLLRISGSLFRRCDIDSWVNFSSHAYEYLATNIKKRINLRVCLSLYYIRMSESMLYSHVWTIYTWEYIRKITKLVKRFFRRKLN